MSSVKKIIGGEECECFEYVHTVDGASGKMRLLLNGVFDGNIERETLMLVPMFLEEAELAAIGDMWLTEQEEELGLPAGESCSSSGWWAGYSDDGRDHKISGRYDFLVPMALAELGTQERVQAELDKWVADCMALDNELDVAHFVGAPNLVELFEGEIDEARRRVGYYENLLRESKMLTVGAQVEYHGCLCEVVSTEYNTVYLQSVNDDSHWELSAPRYLVEACLQEENDKKIEKDNVVDSLGNSLSGMQEAFFKESKVRDEDGRLMVMYHGTPDGSFTAFRPGSYFTPNKAYANVYEGPGASSICPGKEAKNPQTFAVYLNLKKPFDIRDKEARKVYIEDYIKGGNATGINPYLSDEVYAGIQSIDWVEGPGLMEFLLESGYDYDGMILDEGGTGGYGEEVRLRGLSYVNFYPEQVKAIDNYRPTLCGDFRELLSYEEKLEGLKKELFENGIDAIEDFLGFSVVKFDDDAIENLMDKVAEQMPSEEFDLFYQKYCGSDEVDKAMDLFMAGFDATLNEARKLSERTAAMANAPSERCLE